MLSVENGYAKVKRALLVECLTCPLCLNLFRDATTVTVCLHSFCKDCIYQKLEEDETYCCPICSVYLGCSPHDKLRPDNNLQELRVKLFPLNKPKETEAMPAVVIAPARRKERSLSSLVTSTAPVTKKIGGGKSRTSTKKSSALRVQKTQYDDKATEEKKPMDHNSSPEESVPLSVAAATIGSRKQRLAGRDSCPASSHLEPPTKRTAKNSSWEALAFLAETADMADDGTTPLFRLPSMKEGIRDKLMARNAKRLRRKARRSFSSDQQKGDKNHQSNYIEKQRREILGTTDTQMLDDEAIHIGSDQQELHGMKNHSFSIGSPGLSSCRALRKLQPVWFSLHASRDENGHGFPQIPKSFLHVKDGGMPVFCVNKYISQKLNLDDESQIEVTCCGKTLDPNAPLRSLADIWLQQYARASKGKGLLSEHQKPPRINDKSVNDFVIALTYSRKN